MSELSNEPTLNEQIGTLSGDTPLSEGGALGEVTFDTSGPAFVGTGVQGADPMAKLHIPVLKQQTTTTVKTNGGGPGQPAPDASGDLPQNGNTKGLVSFAKKFLGVPYVWGGTSPNGFDCSGFVQYVYKQMGVNLPRISADQARAGKRVGLGDLKPGDLVAWDNSSRNSGADHIAIYIGNGLIIEAPRPGRSVQITRLYDSGSAWGVRLNLGGGGGKRPRSTNPTANKPRDF
jgi:cell wall-associated NlpC family hydrolase